MAQAPDPQVGLGLALRQIRTERNLSQEEVAHRASKHPTWISHLESGTRNPSWGTVRQLCIALDISLADLAQLAEQLEPTKRGQRR